MILSTYFLLVCLVVERFSRHGVHVSIQCNLIALDFVLIYPLYYFFPAYEFWWLLAIFLTSTILLLLLNRKLKKDKESVLRFFGMSERYKSENSRDLEKQE